MHAVNGKKNLIVDLYNLNHSKHNETNNKPCFYIADLDFDGILEKKMISDANFIYLNRYSIENYLVDENAGAVIVNGRTNEGLKNCKNKLNYSNWIDTINNSYKKLLIVYMIAQKLDLDVPNAGLNVARFTKKEKPQLLEEIKITKYLKTEFYKEYRNRKKTGFIRLYLYLEEKVTNMYGKDIWKIIPGKQLLSLYICYLNTLIDNKHLNKSDFENLSSHTCDLSNFTFIKSAIIKYMENFADSAVS
ncbi:DUF4435 domain-containing protein [Paenibacillus polymyxa]|uniref:DUF4435 domain-containing protein n=1 Tax=Paenibacillus polymyxa TaxID=1406 RepID=UPI0004719A83|nr:DUF4435 domain-containing protein [Paenibacillus polymyxa]